MNVQKCLFLVPGSEFLPSKIRLATCWRQESGNYMFSLFFNFFFFFEKGNLSFNCCVAFQFAFLIACFSFRPVCSGNSRDYLPLVYLSGCTVITY